jgi:hypothetical protein
MLLLEGATTMVLECDVERRDRYGRMLAYVWVDGQMVNWALVRQGWAVVLTYPPNVKYVDWFTEAQGLLAKRVSDCGELEDLIACRGIDGGGGVSEAREATAVRYPPQSMSVGNDEAI